jgi:hypothetical protein
METNEVYKILTLWVARFSGILLNPGFFYTIIEL